MKKYSILLICFLLSCASAPMSQNKFIQTVKYGEYIRLKIEDYNLKNGNYPRTFENIFSNSKIRIISNNSSEGPNHMWFKISFVYKGIYWWYKLTVKKNENYENFELEANIISFENKITRNYEYPYRDIVKYNPSRNFQTTEIENNTIEVIDRHKEWDYIIEWQPSLRSLEGGYAVEPNWDQIKKRYEKK